MGQNNTSPRLTISGNQNIVSGVNALSLNTSGISMIMTGSNNTLSDYYTSGTAGNTSQQFIVLGSNNTFSNIQLGDVNIIPVTSMSNAASTITVTGDYIGSSQNRMFIGQYLTIVGTNTTNDRVYRITALAGATVATVTPAPPLNTGAVGSLSFIDVALPVIVGSGVNNARPFGTVGNSGFSNNEEVGTITLGGSGNNYTNINIIPRSWFTTGVVLPFDRPRGVVLTIPSTHSQYTNVNIYKDQYRFSGTILSPPAPNNGVVFAINVSNVPVTGDMNRFINCRIGPIALVSGLPGFGTFNFLGIGNSLATAYTMLAPIGAFSGGFNVTY
jgi:hypothetical protein